MVWSANYKAWGEAKAAIDKAAQAAGIDNKLRFQGQYLDEETGLHYNRHRYYDPHSGRFVSQDPIKLAGGNNLQVYAPNPTMWVDPLGLNSTCCFGNATQPAGIRSKDLEPNADGLLPSQADVQWPSGKSTTVSPETSGLTGHYHKIPEGTEMPEGLAIIRDGADVGGPRSPGHSTVYPTRDMSPGEFNDKFQSLPWEYGGKVK